MGDRTNDLETKLARADAGPIMRLAAQMGYEDLDTVKLAFVVITVPPHPRKTESGKIVKVSGYTRKVEYDRETGEPKVKLNAQERARFDKAIGKKSPGEKAQDVSAQARSMTGSPKPRFDPDVTPKMQKVERANEVRALRSKQRDDAARKDAIRARLNLEDRSLDELVDMRENWALDADELETINDEISFVEDEEMEEALTLPPQASEIPEFGKQYRLIGGGDEPSVARGDALAETEVTPSGHRPLHRISDDIVRNWPQPNFAAAPYLSAMRQLNDITDSYGADSAESVVSYFLNNAAQWRGPEAKRIKAELKAALKAANQRARLSNVEALEMKLASQQVTGYVANRGGKLVRVKDYRRDIVKLLGGLTKIGDDDKGNVVLGPQGWNQLQTALKAKGGDPEATRVANMLTKVGETKDGGIIVGPQGWEKVQDFRKGGVPATKAGRRAAFDKALKDIGPPKPGAPRAEPGVNTTRRQVERVAGEGGGTDFSGKRPDYIPKGKKYYLSVRKSDGETLSANTTMKTVDEDAFGQASEDESDVLIYEVDANDKGKLVKTVKPES
jgi:hypothetical protein